MKMDNRVMFRAWLIEEKEMAVVASIDYKKEEVNYLCDSIHTIETAPVEDLVLMQCTGLTASSSYRGGSEEDRLIYEGDIVEKQYLNLGSKQPLFGSDKYTVIRIDDGCYVGHKEKNDAYSRLSVQSFGATKIIGNIHEHPDLVGEVRDATILRNLRN